MLPMFAESFNEVYKCLCRFLKKNRITESLWEMLKAKPPESGNASQVAAWHLKDHVRPQRSSQECQPVISSGGPPNHPKFVRESGKPIVLRYVPPCS